MKLLSRKSKPQKQNLLKGDENTSTVLRNLRDATTDTLGIVFIETVLKVN